MRSIILSSLSLEIIPQQTHLGLLDIFMSCSRLETVTEVNFSLGHICSLLYFS